MQQTKQISGASILGLFLLIVFGGFTALLVTVDEIVPTGLYAVSGSLAVFGLLLTMAKK